MLGNHLRRLHWPLASLLLLLVHGTTPQMARRAPPIVVASAVEAPAWPPVPREGRLLLREKRVAKADLVVQPPEDVSFLPPQLQQHPAKTLPNPFRIL